MIKSFQSVMVSLSTLVIVKVKTHDQESLISSPVNKFHFLLLKSSMVYLSNGLSCRERPFLTILPFELGRVKKICFPDLSSLLPLNVK